MQYSIVNLSEVKENSDFRIDAEYWKPECIKYKNILSKKIIYKFDNILDIKFGTTPSGANFICNGIPFIRSQDFSTGFIDENIVFISEIDHIKQKKSKIILKDVLIAAVGATIGQIGINLNLEQANTNQNIARVRSNNCNFINEFIFVFLRCKFGQFQLSRLNTGNAQAYLNTMNIANLIIPFLSQAFQQSIADLVNISYNLRQSADTLYKEAENILLEELGLKDYQPQNKKCFVKNLSDTKNAERIDAEYFQPKYEEIIEKIKGYKEGYFILEDEDINDKNFNPKKDAHYKYIELSNISNNATINNVEMIAGDNLPTRARRIVKKDDVIVSSVEGSLNSITLITENYDSSLCSTGFFVLKTENINSESLFVFLKSLIGQMQLKRGCKGTILTAIDKKELKQLIIPLLPEQIQSLISLKIQQSFGNREKSKQLLEVAKRAVEIAIEENEDAGLKYIEDNKFSM